MRATTPSSYRRLKEAEQAKEEEAEGIIPLPRSILLQNMGQALHPAVCRDRGSSFPLTLRWCLQKPRRVAHGGFRRSNCPFTPRDLSDFVRGRFCSPQRPKHSTIFGFFRLLCLHFQPMFIQGVGTLRGKQTELCCPGTAIRALLHQGHPGGDKGEIVGAVPKERGHGCHFRWRIPPASTVFIAGDTYTYIKTNQTREAWA